MTRHKDLDPIMQIASGYLCVAVHPSVPAKARRANASKIENLERAQ
ncbi:hypothetical protein [Bradyrhizobium sp. 200]|nr:hypothetical protein [Bradyrhizobium sp. 200]